MTRKIRLKTAGVTRPRHGPGMPEMPSVPLVSQISLLAVMPHDLGEAQRDDGQVVAAQPRGDQRHHGAGRRGEHHGAPATPSTIGTPPRLVASAET